MWYVKVAQSCPTLCDSMDYTAHGILQVSILKNTAFQNTAFHFFRGIFPNQGLNPGLPYCRQIVHQLSHRKHWILTPIHPSEHSSIDIFSTFTLRFYIFRKCGFGRGTDTKPMEQIREPRKRIIQKAHLIFNKDIEVIEWMRLSFWQLELEQVDTHR